MRRTSIRHDKTEKSALYLRLLRARTLKFEDILWHTFAVHTLLLYFQETMASYLVNLGTGGELFVEELSCTNIVRSHIFQNNPLYEKSHGIGDISESDYKTVALDNEWEDKTYYNLPQYFYFNLFWCLLLFIA